MITIEGTVEDIIFKNESNGYTVAVLQCEEDSITIVGYIPFLKIGETLKVDGDFVYHPVYGEQVNVENCATITPSTIKGIEKYLSSGLIPCIGPKTAKKIVKRFGEDSLDIIQYNPERLKEIDGIGDKKLKRIVEAFNEQRDLKDIMVFLQQYGISTNYGLKIYKKYGSETIKKIQENPYRLCEDIFGIGFKTADKVAQSLGVEMDSPYRINAGIKFKIMEAASNGHSFLPKEELVKGTKNMLGVEEDSIEEGIRDLAVIGDVYLENFNEEVVVYYKPLYVAENNVSRKIIELSMADVDKLNIDVDKEIEKIEEEDEISFAEKQKLAIKESVENGITVITGGPGTGKTTTINAIIRLFEKKNLSIALAAPTGRAAKRMSEATDREAKTIHRLLEYSFFDDDGMMGFGRNEDEPLDVDVVIIDEMSMVDIILMNNLLKAIVSGTRLILVGDVDQLPSVGPGNVLKDIIKSGIVKVVELDEIFRQAQESMIIVNAHRINAGMYPYLNVKDKDFFFIVHNNQEEISNTIADLVRTRLPNFNGYDPIKDIQVLSPMKKGEVGTKFLNRKLQKYLNPKHKGVKEKKVGDEIFRVGDKVMQIRNNYSTEWTMMEDGKVVEGEGVFNGDFGYIQDIDTEDSILTVLFDDGREVEYDFNQLDELMLAYATTVHKSQGSEFPVVIMPIFWGPPMLMTRNLLYTAVTRAKEMVVLVGMEKYLYMMIGNNKIAKRYSSLHMKLRRIGDIF